MNKVLESRTEDKKRDRKIVHIINPVSGSGRKFRKTRNKITELDEEIYLTKREGDCEDFVSEILSKDPYIHIVAHGGDGTMSEVAGGIMKAGAGQTALFTGVPTGSGNDFLHYMYTEKNTYGKTYPTDLIYANGKYAINVVNMGFDCTVVSEASKIRKIPGFGGNFSYIAGVATTFLKKESFKTEIKLDGAVSAVRNEEHSEKICDDFLLIAIANGKYYGGGFKAAPIADSSDGYMDIVAVKNVSRPTFIALVADYKKGEFMSDEFCRVKDKFKNIIYFRRCKKISFDGISEICYDGEICKASSISAEIIPEAIIYTPPKKAWIE